MASTAHPKAPSKLDLRDDLSHMNKGDAIYTAPSGLLAIIMKAMGMEEHFSGVLTTSAAYSGFSFVVGFLLVFRTSQSYAREVNRYGDICWKSDCTVDRTQVR